MVFGLFKKDAKLNNPVAVEIQYGDETLRLETGRMAKQANGSVLATMGDTMVLATVCAEKAAVEGQDFFPLTVDYQEKFVEKDGFSVVVDNEGQIITDMALLAHLRGVRTDIAKEEKRPAYTIITNKGLVSLATYRPTTKEEFISLYGLGETTYQSFGNKFISAIKDFYNQQT